MNNVLFRINSKYHFIIRTDYNNLSDIFLQKVLKTLIMIDPLFKETEVTTSDLRHRAYKLTELSFDRFNDYDIIDYSYKNGSGSVYGKNTIQLHITKAM